ncbi:MAG: methyltransferase domain-containing protein, partial [Actinoplanes sp.]
MSTACTPATLRWLDALWPFVRAYLPPTPGRVLEIGCGEYGGFVPAMRGLGHDAVGVDPAAPPGADYHRITVEQYAPTSPVDAIVACASLHHVGDLATVLDRVRAILAPGGPLIVVEWDYERFDEATARWCFDRLPASGGPGWLADHRRQWLASGQPWPVYRDAWVERERLHSGDAMIKALRARFGTRLLGRAPYFFADLESTGAAAE